MARHNLISNIVAYGFSNGLAALSPLLLLPILTRIFTPHELGTYAMYIMVCSIFTILLGLNHHGAISVNYHKMDRRNFIELLKAALFLPFLCLIVLCIACFVFIDFITGYAKLNSMYIYLAIFAAFVNVYLLLFLAVLQTSSQPLKYLAIKLTQTLSDIALTCLFVLYLYYGINGRVFSYNVALALAALVGFILVLRSGFSFGLKELSFKADFLKRIFIYGVPLVPHTISGVMLMYVDRIMLANIVDLGAVGLYMAALQVSMMFLMIIEPVNKAYAPWLYSKLLLVTIKEKTKIVKMTYCYFLLLVLLSFVLTFFSKIFYEDFVGVEFSAGRDLLPIMFLGLAFQGMYYSVTNYILFSERTGVLSAISGFVVIVGAVCSFFLTSKLGITGAAYSFMITNLLLFLGVWFFSNKFFPMPWFSIFSYRPQS